MKTIGIHWTEFVNKFLKLDPQTKEADDDFAEVDFANGSSSLQPSPTRFVVEIYTDFDSQAYKPLELDKSSTALQVLQILLADSHCGDCTNWTIVEWKRGLCMWRIIEDHEELFAIQESWTTEIDGEYNRFLVKQDFCKYEILRNPKQFLPTGMLSITNEKMETLSSEHPATQNSLLRTLLLTTDWLAEVEGWIFLRDKKTWKKHYAFLRPSGLYVSEKSTSKDPKHLVLTCSLETAQIYQVENGKKMLGAASDSVICIAQPRDFNAKYICYEDDETRRNWITAMRLHKCGKQMKINYQAAVNADELLNTTENIKELALQEEMKSRVPMDFSGKCGRVIVEDQQEAIQALLAEVQGWKKRRTGRCLESPGSPTGYPVHLSQPWFHPGMTREEANRLLSKQGLVDGVFLVRKSRSEPRSFVLSFAFSGKTKHQPIAYVKSNDQICISLDDGKTKFADLNQLIEFYQLNIGSLPCKLTYPLKLSESPRR